MEPHYVCSEYIALGLPVVARRKENSRASSKKFIFLRTLAGFLTQLGKGAHLDLRQGHAFVVPLENASRERCFFY